MSPIKVTQIIVRSATTTIKCGKFIPVKTTTCVPSSLLSGTKYNLTGCVKQPVIKK